MNRTTGGQLLMPAAEAARKLGMSRWTLNRRIEAKEIRAVKVGPRRFIPQSEIERIISGQSAQISAPKPATDEQVSNIGANCSNLSRESEFSDEFSIFGDCRDAAGEFDSKIWFENFQAALMRAESEAEELEQDVRAGDSNALVAKAAFEELDNLPFKWEGPNTTNSPERQKAIEAHHATWRVWREGRLPKNPSESASIT